jgi:serine/threonine-protein kinase
MSIPRYEIRSKLGSGYMGEVYHAFDAENNRDVALKFLPARFTSEEDIARFRQESLILFRLDHPNVVRIYAFEEKVPNSHFADTIFQSSQEYVYFIVDEFIPGLNLRQYMAANKISPKDAVRIAIEIAKALSHAHAKGVIHRDIKPDNIMVTSEGDVRVLDFGMAKFMGWFLEQQLALPMSQRVPVVITGPDEVLGTASYMSPEQWGQVQRDRQSAIDERTDVWSLGVVLYELLTGINPFVARTTEEVRMLVALVHPPPLSEHMGRGSRRFQRIVSRALKKDRGDRYQAIEQMLHEMDNLLRRVERRWFPWQRINRVNHR